MSDSGTKTGCACGCQGAGPMLTDLLKRLGPSDAVRQHFTNAHLELLKGIRAFLDDQIQPQTRAPEQGTRIPVD